MISIAIVEDEKNDTDLLIEYLERFKAETGKQRLIDFKIKTFDNAVLFLTNYTPSYDIVFMDIQMPHLNGMNAAKKLREIDLAVQLVFVTNMSNFAVRGYSVDAVDFIVKPISYYGFSTAMERLIKIIERKQHELTIKTADEIKRVPLVSIYRIDIFNHKLLYYTDEGLLESWGKLNEEEARLAPYGFARPNNYCLVNLKRIDEIKKDSLVIKEKEIEISRARKKTFLKDFMAYAGGIL